MVSDIHVRTASPQDASAIAAIYAPHVLNGTASFEIEEPNAEEILRRRAAVLELGLPYLVADINGEVVGYAYASRFRPRSAYRYTVENSVYVGEPFQRRGVARLLIRCLIEKCAKAGIREMIAVVGNPAENISSVRLHRALGFEDVGVLRRVGEKFGRTLDVLITLP